VKLNKAVAFGAAVGVALAGIAFSAPASAEPVTGTYSITGSDTLQDVINALTNGTNVTTSPVRVVSNGGPVGNFDAFGGALIQAKPFGPIFQRPNGSSAGRDSLRASMSGNNWGPIVTLPVRPIPGQVDIARTSSAPPAAEISANGRLLYVPFGRDAVSYAYKLAAGVVAPAGIDTLTTAQLTAFYNGTVTTLGGTTVVPRLPIFSSGTRQFFQLAIGVPNASLGSGIDAASAGVPENDANQLNPAPNTIQIIPFSVAQWVAQSNGVANSDSTLSPGAVFGSANGIAPFTGTRPNLVPAPAFYSAAPFGRDTYLIVEAARVLDPAALTYDAGLAALMNPALARSLTNFSSGPTTAGAVKRIFGFLPVASTTPIRAYPNG